MSLKSMGFIFLKVSSLVGDPIAATVSQNDKSEYGTKDFDI